MADVGVIGLGDMGAAMARSMVAAGLRLVVHDIRAEAMASLVELGATSAASIAAVAEQADMISIVVLDDGQVRSVVEALAPVAHPGTTLIVHSTVQPATVVELAGEVAERGIDLIDATVSGGAEKAAMGRLTVMIGGPDEVVRRGWPVFEAIGAHLFHLGPVGAGATAKVVNNLLSLGSYALQLEAMEIAAAYGLDEEAVTTVVAASQGDSRGIRTWGRMDRIRRGRRESRDASAVYEQISKDLRTAAKVGGARGLVLPITATAAAVLPSKLAERDRALDALDAERQIPRCDGCRQELAAPYRAAGRHPECV